METIFRRREQEVWQACDDLWSLYGDMSQLTGEAIKSRLVSLGKSRGSPNEIYKYRRSWEDHRGIKRGASSGLSGVEDPIARAARLVHDEIKASAQNEINELSENFQKEIKTLQDKISQLEESLKKTVYEYSALASRLEQSEIALESTKNILHSEEEMRIAVERELSQVRIIAEEKEVALMKNIDSLKDAHEREISRLMNEEKLRFSKAQETEKQLKEEIKNLGHQYSEELSTMKVAQFNQRILYEKIETRAQFLEKQLLEQKNSFEEKETVLKSQISSLSDAYQTLKIERIENRALYVAEQKKLRSLIVASKKSDITVARLRESLLRSN